jgi:hypothetical protein
MSGRTPNRFNADEIAIIKRTPNDMDIELFIRLSKRANLDPFSRQMYALLRKELRRHE